MMSFKKKINRWVQRKQADVERGREITLQMQDERRRRREKRYDNMKPSTMKTLLWGLKTRASPMDVMKMEYERRRHNRGK